MQLVDFYAHARLGDLTFTEFEGMARRLEERITRISTDFSPRRGKADNSELLYQFEEGSVKTRAKIVGALMATYMAISQYPGFRKGVIELYNDSLAISSAMFQEFKNVTGTKDKDVIYKRSISRDMNRLKRLSDAIDLLLNPHLSEAEAVFCRDMIISQIAGLRRANPADPSIERLLDMIPRKRFPTLPKDIDEIAAIDEQRRRAKLARRETAGRKLVGGQPQQGLPRRTYERLHKM